MSVFGYLICHEKKKMLRLGSVIRETLPDGTKRILAYHLRSESDLQNSERPELNKALWKFLAETQGCSLIAKTDYEMTDDEFDFTSIGGDVPPKDISFEDYLRDWKW